jgi:hypothetical protein
MTKKPNNPWYSACECSECGEKFNVFEKGMVGAVLSGGTVNGFSINQNSQHINFCAKCAKKLGFHKYKKGKKSDKDSKR